MSLNSRIVLAASLVLTIFLALTGIALEQAFKDSARTARQERLQGQLYLLIAAAEVDGQGRLSMSEPLTESRFGQPGSGLYGIISGDAGEESWRSISSLNIALPSAPPLAAGKSSFILHEGAKGTRFFISRMGVSWIASGKSHAFTFSVAEDLDGFNKQLVHYRRSLWGWLGAMALLLLLAQATLLRWGLRPLRRVAAEVREIENGEREQLGDDYPSELLALTENLNGLLQRERAQQKRYRDALGDLAHSLKTPLAVMRGALSERSRGALSEQPGAPSLADTVAEETVKMQHIVDYQLQRAATAGPSSRLAAPVEIRPVAVKIVASLSKVYQDKNITVTLDIQEGLVFRGDRGDLLELLGNLLDNACKWSVSRIKLSAAGGEGQVILRIEDDGPGIPPDEIERITQRGFRADQSTPGQGIGLAVTASIVLAYGGEIGIAPSPLGGAGITITLPS